MNKFKTYKCWECNSSFIVQEVAFDYTEATYCINCGNASVREVDQYTRFAPAFWQFTVEGRGRFPLLANQSHNKDDILKLAIEMELVDTEIERFSVERITESQYYYMVNNLNDYWEEGDEVV